MAPLEDMAQKDYEQKVWADGAHKLEGICRDAAEAARAGLNVLALAHFESTLAAVGAKLRERAIEHYANSPLDSSALCGAGRDGAGEVWLAPATYLQRRGSFAPGQAGAESLCVLVAEHHPLASKDRAVVEAALTLPCRSRVIFHAALTDPLLLHFGGERTLQLLKRLGHDDAESISHPFIVGAIQRAQEKIEAQVRTELPTQSPEDWFKYNLKSRG